MGWLMVDGLVVLLVVASFDASVDLLFNWLVDESGDWLLSGSASALLLAALTAVALLADESPVDTEPPLPCG